MAWLLDSNVWIKALAGIQHATTAIVQASVLNWAGYSAITRLEVLGYTQLTTADESNLILMLSQFQEVAVSSLIIDEAIGIRKQSNVKVPDAIIAATALIEKADLVTRNIADFRSIKGLPVIDPITL